MIRRGRFLALFAAVLCGCAGDNGGKTADREPTESGAFPATPPALVRAPDIVLIVVDTLRRDHLGYHGYSRSTSPHIDRLAADSIRYLNAFSQSSWTIPSVASLLTSRYPSALGIDDLDTGIRPEERLLQEVLQWAGYETAAIVSHRFVSGRWGFDQGFSVFDESAVYEEAEPSRKVAERAMEFLDRERDRPFFLLLHLFDPHFPYQTHETFDFTNDLSSTEGLHDYLAGKKRLAHVKELLAAREEYGPVDLQWLHAIYDSEIAFLDHHLGAVLDHMRDAGTYDSSLIVFTADHGEEFLERGFIGHERSLHQELIGVPLLIKFPEADRSGDVDEPVGLIDVHPTILEYLGVEVDRSVEGRILPMMRQDPAPGRRLLYSEISRDDDELRCVVEGDLKLIWNVRRSSYSLHDLARDPGEKVNVRQDRPEDFERLRLELEAWRAYVTRGETEADPVSLTDQEVESLRGLGYLN